MTTTPPYGAPQPPPDWSAPPPAYGQAPAYGPAAYPVDYPSGAYATGHGGYGAGPQLADGASGSAPTCSTPPSSCPAWSSCSSASAWRLPAGP